jgi:hypothetical protein
MLLQVLQDGARVIDRDDSFSGRLRPGALQVVLNRPGAEQDICRSDRLMRLLRAGLRRSDAGADQEEGTPSRSLRFYYSLFYFSIL